MCLAIGPSQSDEEVILLVEGSRHQNLGERCCLLDLTCQPFGDKEQRNLFYSCFFDEIWVSLSGPGKAGMPATGQECGEERLQARDICFSHCPRSVGPPGTSEVRTTLEQAGMLVRSMGSGQLEIHQQHLI